MSAASFTWGADMKNLAISVGLATAVWFIPPPAGVTSQASQGEGLWPGLQAACTPGKLCVFIASAVKTPQLAAVLTVGIALHWVKAFACPGPVHSFVV